MVELILLIVNTINDRAAVDDVKRKLIKVLMKKIASTKKKEERKRNGKILVEIIRKFKR